MFCALLLPILAGSMSIVPATWDVKEIGIGGQPMLAANDKGVVYLAHHQPGTLLVSRDWGATFPETRAFPDALSDVRITAWGDRLQLSHLCTGVAGIRNYYSFDAGKSLKEGGKIAGDMDRASIVYNAKSADLSLITSLGYPGGPASQGVLAYRSTDYGRTFTKTGRADEELMVNQAVDPNLAVGTDGTIYATWAVSKNNSNLSSTEFATSSNGGKTWKNRTQIAKLSTKGDTQERWMLGGLLAAGDRIVAYYPDYVERDIAGEKRQILLTHYRVSEDGGANFGPSQVGLSSTELDEILKTQSGYRQTMPTMALDSAGNIHLAFLDNREGASPDDAKFTKWAARYAMLPKGAKEFGPSEAISPSFASIRPPLELIGCAVDSKYVYVSWCENPGSTEVLDYRGHLFFGRKAVGP